ncbi:pyridoxamine 5'-phosphate oxidase family protein [Ornithinimicrobium sediminis]|uniref:pyridoxamine 5'-phosphate oxidase family protein n=1 Tax=Ornithinimicrobium sediminis TaxID=2904603 RepID=UPI001E351759|nr:pyridoxamine 5'-phosphate oxidase family protein [Ornithinimicrobium sediminis]MCE0487100.1 pyridoxamine 5'-phosphate oxidase family protein [Ornithinimicrobium sediminis]
MNDMQNELPDTECWELLASQELGRLGYHLLDEVHVVPINYVALPDQERLVFRTTEGSKLLGIVMHGDVAFEIDQVGERQAWSVVARGRAVQLDGDDARQAMDLPIHPWVADDRYVLVAIKVTEVTGRRYDLLRPRT